MVHLSHLSESQSSTNSLGVNKHIKYTSTGMHKEQKTLHCRVSSVLILIKFSANQLTSQGINRTTNTLLQVRLETGFNGFIQLGLDPLKSRDVTWCRYHGYMSLNLARDSTKSSWRHLGVPPAVPSSASAPGTEPLKSVQSCDRIKRYIFTASIEIYVIKCIILGLFASNLTRKCATTGSILIARQYLQPATTKTVYCTVC